MFPQNHHTSASHLLALLQQTGVTDKSASAGALSPADALAASQETLLQHLQDEISVMKQEKINTATAAADAAAAAAAEFKQQLMQMKQRQVTLEQ
jgi:hypothetical protein